MMLVQLSEADADGTTELHKGDTVELRLPETSATGYSWRWRLPEALQMVADEELSPGAGPESVGQAGCRRLAFAVIARGIHEIRVELARPWESEPRQALTFVIHAL